MILKVERLGPVDRAEIDLTKDLILFAGPNGTGKTYLAWATYGLLNAFMLGHMPILMLMRRILAPTAKRMLESGRSEVDLALVVREHGQEILVQIARTYARQRIAADFAADKRLFHPTVLHVDASNDTWQVATLNSATSFGRMNLNGGLTSRREIGSSVIRIAATRAMLDHSQTQAFLESGVLSEDLIPLDQLTDEERLSHQDPLADLLGSWMVNAWRHLRPVIFPAERIATTIFWRELSLKRAELVDEMLSMEDKSQGQVLEFIRNRAQRYPLPIRDSLQMAGDLEQWSRQTSEFVELADYLEQQLLRGKVRLSQYGELMFAPDQRSDVAIGMHITASVVKSLSLLVFYFRHMAQKGDFVIIDEPELNLHPDNQRLIARVLARAVNRGLKIMASTHSDYLVRELNNLIMLSQDTEPVKALRQKHGYEEAELLKPSQLGVYLFRDSAAEVVPVDETGFSIATIDAEIDRLNAVSQEIYATLFEQDPE